MISPPGRQGVAFSEGSDGDLRGDTGSRRRISGSLGISEEWATVHQVHGHEVHRVETPGDAGHADGLWTSERGLPLAVFTADCFGVVLHADNAVGVAHAGWRGVDAGVVNRLRSGMADAGHVPLSAEIGPGIGPCCFEVGTEVAERFSTTSATTTWGTTSVDLTQALKAQLEGTDVWTVGSCTMHEPDWFSHRQDATPMRLATLGWVP